MENYRAIRRGRCRTSAGARPGAAKPPPGEVSSFATEDTAIEPEGTADSSYLVAWASQGVRVLRVDAIPAVRGRRGRPRRRPGKAHLDNGYDYPRCRRALRQRGICPRIARRGVESRQRLGRFRRVVERTFAWLHAFRPRAGWPPGRRVLDIGEDFV